MPLHSTQASNLHSTVLYCTVYSLLQYHSVPDFTVVQCAWPFLLSTVLYSCLLYSTLPFFRPNSILLSLHSTLLTSLLYNSTTTVLYILLTSMSLHIVYAFYLFLRSHSVYSCHNTLPPSVYTLLLALTYISLFTSVHSFSSSFCSPKWFFFSFSSNSYLEYTVYNTVYILCPVA